MPNGTRFKNPYREMKAEFDENCLSVLDPSAVNKVRELYRKGILALLESGKMDWSYGPHRKFALSCAAGLGRRVDALAQKENGVVTGEIVHKAAKTLVKCWERVCPLPEAGPRVEDEEGVERITCPTLRSALREDSSTP